MDYFDVDKEMVFLFLVLVVYKVVVEKEFVLEEMWLVYVVLIRVKE